MKYEYVRIKSETFMGARFEEHRRVIDEYAKRGLVYVGYIPVKENVDGNTREIDLIFGKEE